MPRKMQLKFYSVSVCIPTRKTADNLGIKIQILCFDLAQIAHKKQEMNYAKASEVYSTEKYTFI